MHKFKITYDDRTTRVVEAKGYLDAVTISETDGRRAMIVTYLDEAESRSKSYAVIGTTLFNDETFQVSLHTSGGVD